MTTLYVSTEHRYLRVAQELRTRVRNGVYAPRTQVPGERTLAKELHVSRQTVVKALRLLQGEKLLYHVTGRGYFVAVPGEQPRCPYCGSLLDDTRVDEVGSACAG